VPSTAGDRRPLFHAG